MTKLGQRRGIKLDRYEAGIGLQPAARSPGKLVDYNAKAMGDLGAQIQGLGEAIVERKRKREAFDDEVAYRGMEAQLEGALQDASQNMQPGGDGFTDGFLSSEFQSITTNYLNSIEDPELRERRAAQIGVLQEEYRTDAAGVEYKELVRFQSTALQEAAEQARIRIANDPDSFDAEMAYLDQQVAASNLPPIARHQLRAQLAKGGAQAFLQGLLDNDPWQVLNLTGGSIADIPPDRAAPHLVGSMLENAPDSIRSKDERVGLFGMHVDGYRMLAEQDGVDLSQLMPGEREALLSNPVTARAYAARYMEHLLTEGGFTNTEDAIVAFYMGEDFAKGEWTRRDLPKPVQKSLRQTLSALTGQATRPAANYGTPIKQYAQAIGYIESRNRYDELGSVISYGGGKDRAYGRYQVMGTNVGPWTKKWYGRELTPEEFLANPRAQDAVFEGQFGSYLESHSLDDAVAMWFTGQPLGVVQGGDVHGTTGSSYVSSFRAALAQQGGITTSRPNIPLTDGNGNPIPLSSYDDIDPQLITIAQTVFSQFGWTELPITSAERSFGSTAGVGNNSQHVVRDAHGNKREGHSGALDIPWNGLKTAERVQLIEALSAAGVTGIGLYDWGLHIDLAGRRAWGADYGGGSVPEWAKDVIARHLAGEVEPTFVPRADTRVAAAGYDFVLGAREEAIKALGGMPSADEGRAGALQYMEDTLATYEAGGDMPSMAEMSPYLSLLTPSQQQSYTEKMNVAEAVRSYTDGIETADPGALASMENITQTAIPLNPSAAAKVEERVRRAVAEEIEMRAENPAEAALRHPEVEELWMAYQNAQQQGDLSTAPLEAVTAYIEKSREVQSEVYGLHPDDVRSVPDVVLHTIGSQLDNYTRAEDITRTDRDTELRLFAQRLVDHFGEYADEVLAEAIAEMQGSNEGGSSPEAVAQRALRRVMKAEGLSYGARSSRSSTGAETPADGEAAAEPFRNVDATDAEAVDSAANSAAVTIQRLEAPARAAFLRSLPPGVRDKMKEMGY